MEMKEGVKPTDCHGWPLSPQPCQDLWYKVYIKDGAFLSGFLMPLKRHFPPLNLGQQRSVLVAPTKTGDIQKEVGPPGTRLLLSPLSSNRDCKTQSCPSALLPANSWELLVPLNTPTCQAWYKYRLAYCLRFLRLYNKLPQKIVRL